MANNAIKNEIKHLLGIQNLSIPNAKKFLKRQKNLLTLTEVPQKNLTY